jgi:catechol 2,3-dioxygenase-like lactoylglutathione lyase family enzyme
MRIDLTSVLVDDQAKALSFYTDMLGFVKKTEVPLGENSWLTVVSPEEPGGVELVLEPDEHPAARPFKQALVEDGIPFTSFTVDEVAAEYERLVSRGVRSHNRQPTWARSPQPCSTTPAATSSRSQRAIDDGVLTAGDEVATWPLRLCGDNEDVPREDRLIIRLGDPRSRLGVKLGEGFDPQSGTNEGVQETGKRDIA